MVSFIKIKNIYQRKLFVLLYLKEISTLCFFTPMSNLQVAHQICTSHVIRGPDSGIWVARLMREKGMYHIPGGVLEYQEDVKPLINLYLCEWIKYI